MIFRMITEPLLVGFITPYAMILSLCSAAGLFLSIWLYGEEKILLLDTGLGILVFSLLGARAGFVIRNFSYFVLNPMEAFQFWLGGLSWPGALLGGAIAAVVICLIWKEPLGEMVDRLLPLFGVMVLAIWLTGWGAGIGYGPVTDAWYGIPVRDTLGEISRRWPLPIIGALLSGAWVAGVILYPLKKTHRAGTRTLGAIMGISGINFIFSLLRVDPAPVYFGLRWESWFSLFFVLVSTIVLLFIRTKGNYD